MKKIFLLTISLLVTILISANISFAQQQTRTGGVKPAKPTTNTKGTVSNSPTNTTAGASTTTAPQGTETKPEALATKRTESLKKRLLLNADQEKSTYEAYLKFFRVVDKAKVTYPNKGEEYAKLIRDARINRDAEILKVLNPEQAKKFKNINNKQVEKGKAVGKGKAKGKDKEKKHPQNHHQNTKDSNDDDDDDEDEDDSK